MSISLFHQLVVCASLNHKEVMQRISRSAAGAPEEERGENLRDGEPYQQYLLIAFEQVRKIVASMQDDPRYAAVQEMLMRAEVGLGLKAE